VNISPRVDSPSDDSRFPLARKGYEREAVDHFVRATHIQIAQLLQQYDSLMVNNHELRQAVDEANARATQADFSGLGGRVQELLHIAEEQATDITQRAVQEADRLSAQVHAEINELRQSAAAELAQLRDAQLAELDALRQRGEQDALQLRQHAKADAEQLLTSTRLQAEAVRAEAEAAATGMRKAASFESQELLAAAERDSAAIRQEVADHRERLLAELKQAQDSANHSIQSMLAEATELQRVAAEHLTEETDHVAQVRSEMLAEAERLKVDASADAEHIIDRARHQAAAIDNRARQELALRRRQMRDEQDLLNRRKHAMLNQLTSLSALAVETAENLPDVPDVADTEFADLGGFGSVGRPGGNDAEMESDPTIGDAADETHEEGQQDAAQAADDEPELRARPEQGELSDAAGENESHAVDGDGMSGTGEAGGESSTDQHEYARASKPSAA
jgi:hypothetical protein